MVVDAQLVVHRPILAEGLAVVARDDEQRVLPAPGGRHRGEQSTQARVEPTDRVSIQLGQSSGVLQAGPPSPGRPCPLALTDKAAAYPFERRPSAGFDQVRLVCIQV